MIAPIPLDVYKALSISMIYSAGGAILALLPSLKRFREDLKSSIGIDSDTGMSHYPAKKIRRLLDFRPEKYMAAAVVSTALFVVFLVSYLVASATNLSIGDTWPTALATILTWIGLLLYGIALYTATRLYLYAISLWMNLSRQ
jgi:hypothetical protein